MMPRHLAATNAIMERAERDFLALHVWNAENGRALEAISLKMMRATQMGATAAENAAYYQQRYARLPSLTALKTEARAYNAVEVAEADLRIARGRYVDADDATLQAILTYKAERDRDGYLIVDRRQRAILYVHKRRAARAKVQAALAHLRETRGAYFSSFPNQFAIAAE